MAKRIPAALNILVVVSALLLVVWGTFHLMRARLPLPPVPAPAIEPEMLYGEAESNGLIIEARVYPGRESVTVSLKNDTREYDYQVALVSPHWFFAVDEQGQRYEAVESDFDPYLVFHHRQALVRVLVLDRPVAASARQVTFHFKNINYGIGKSGRSSMNMELVSEPIPGLTGSSARRTLRGEVTAAEFHITATAYTNDHLL